MKNLIIIFALILPDMAFSQSPKRVSRKEKAETAKKQLFAEIKTSEFIVKPSDYLCGYSPKDIASIEFERDNLNYPSDKNPHASITEKDGFDKDYSIGIINDYLIRETEARYIIHLYMKDGSHHIKYPPILWFGNGMITQSDDFYYADYNVDGDPITDTNDENVTAQ